MALITACAMLQKPEEIRNQLWRENKDAVFGEATESASELAQKLFKFWKEFEMWHPGLNQLQRFRSTP